MSTLQRLFRRYYSGLPSINRNTRIKVTRLTGNSGTTGHVSGLGNMVMPGAGTYSLYTLSTIHAGLVGIQDELPHELEREWVSGTKLVNSSIEVMVYIGVGIMVPAQMFWLKRTSVNELLLAVKMNNTLPYTRAMTDIFIQFYRRENNDNIGTAIASTMEFWGRTVASAGSYGISGGYDPYTGTTADIKTTTYINGEYMYAPITATVRNGDVVEVLTDTAIERELVFPISALRSFTSEVDKCVKLLAPIHGEEMQRYIGDMIIHVFYKVDEITRRGRYVHTNDIRNIRQCGDWISVSVDLVQALIADMVKDRGVTTEFYLSVKLRKAMKRPRQFDAQRLHELRRLPFATQEQIVLSTTDDTGIWRASELEKGIAIIRDKEPNLVSDADVLSALGHNAIVTLLGNNITHVTEAITLPPDIYADKSVSVVYKNGLIHNTFSPANPLLISEAELASDKWIIEYIPGTSVSGAIRTTRTNDDVTFVYNTMSRQHIIGTDYTSGSGFDIVHYRHPDDVLVANFNVEIENDKLQFSLTDRFGLTVPFVNFTTMRFFMDGYELQNNVDIVQDDDVYIITAKHAINLDVATQQVHVVGYGVSQTTTDIKLNSYVDYGYVINGTISDDAKYRVNLDKQYRFTMDGKLVLRDDIIFSELDQTVRPVDIRNGMRYHITPLTPRLPDDISITAGYILDAVMRDGQVEQTMTKYLPDNKADLNIITPRYRYVLPFIASLIQYIRDGGISRDNVSLLRLSGYSSITSLFKREYMVTDTLMKSLDDRFTLRDSTFSDAPISLTSEQLVLLNDVMSYLFPGKLLTDEFIVE